MRDEDVEALAAMLARAYREGDPARMAKRLRLALAHGTTTFVAEREGIPAGMVLANDYGTTSYIALMGVDPSFQRQRIGHRLMDALAAWLDARRIPAELQATPEGRGLYLRYGFVDAGEARVWFGRARPGGDVSGVRAAEPADHDRIRAIDSEAFGARREQAIRGLLDDATNAVFVAPEGYSVAQRVARVVGPVIAEDPATAARLFRAAAAAIDGEHRVNAPARADVDALLREHGYRHDRDVRRMVRGAPPDGARDRVHVLVNLGQG
jgi:predicted N-acetyltransferase YhbS